MRRLWILFVLTCSVNGHLLSHSRRDLLVGSFTFYPSILLGGHEGYINDRRAAISHPFHYSRSWSGTNLPLLSLEQAAAMDHWTMARWPDPILRSIAAPVVPPQQHLLQRASQLLRAAAQRENAVGLAAQQCGVNVRMIYLRLSDNDEDDNSSSITMINPQILERSPEQEMRVWTESCLVLPPTFTATVLRDAVVRVAYQACDGTVHERRLRGEAARALQHEMDHDRGILVTDHVGLSELENDIMRNVEQEGHAERMQRAYERY